MNLLTAKHHADAVAPPATATDAPTAPAVEPDPVRAPETERGNPADRGQLVWRCRVGMTALLFLMSCWGCLGIYHAMMHTAHPYHFAGRQLAWLIVGMAVLGATSAIPFRYWRAWLPVMATVALAALVLVLVLGVQRQGMRGWFAVGPWLVQPSEFAKPVFLLWACRLALTHPERPWQLVLLAAGWLVPLLLQPDFGMVAIYVLALLLVVILAGGRWWQVIATMILLAPPVLAMLVQHDYVWARLDGFLQPDADPLGRGWHLCQLRHAVARGGWGGVGWGAALWAHAYLPLAHSDSVYAAMAEALGVRGGLPVMLAFPVLAWLGGRLAGIPGDPVARLYIRCFAMMVAAQGLIHLGVNLGMLPITGITLPFFSYGGSSLVSLLFGFGLLNSALGANPGNDHPAAPG